jgi:putative Mn2+ efflux pump MntP
MFSLEILLLGIALAVDAAVVTFAVGLLHSHDPLPVKVRNGLVASGTFGIFQFLMLWAGSYAGFLLTFSDLGFYFRIVITAIFFGLAVKCLKESYEDQGKKIEWGVVPILVLAFATSLDALASGISLGTIPRAWLSALEVGIVTSLICSLFYFIAQFLKQIPERWLLRFSSLIFVFLGLKVFWGMRHLFMRG